MCKWLNVNNSRSQREASNWVYVKILHVYVKPSAAAMKNSVCLLSREVKWSEALTSTMDSANGNSPTLTPYFDTA